MLQAPNNMTFKVTYNYKPRTFDENGKYVDNDTYTISIIEDGKMERNEKGLLDISTGRTINVTVTEDELDQLYDEMKKAIWDRNDTRGYHE